MSTGPPAQGRPSTLLVLLRRSGNIGADTITEDAVNRRAGLADLLSFGHDFLLFVSPTSCRRCDPIFFYFCINSCSFASALHIAECKLRGRDIQPQGRRSVRPGWGELASVQRTVGAWFRRAIFRAQPGPGLAACQEELGQTAATLWRRWRPALVVLDATRPIQIRSNELMDRNRFQEAARGRRFEVWFKQALTTSLRYIPGFQYEALLREAEEVYLERYYKPVLGRLLEGRAHVSGAEQPKPS